MPRPTRFIADQFREVDQSLQGEDRSGEIEAQSLQSLGRGVSQLGEGIARYQQRKKALDIRRVSDDATNASLSGAQGAIDFALTNPDGEPDGSDMVDTFNQGYDELKANYMDTLSNDEERGQAEIIFERQRLMRTEKLLGQQRQKHLEYTVNKAEENRIQYNTQVMNDPSQFSLAMKSVDDSNSAMLEAGVIPADKIDLVRQKGRKDLVYSAIDGMTLIGQDYNEAIGDIVQGRFSQLLNGDEKRKLIQVVQQRKLQAANLDLQEIARDRAESKQLREENQDETFKSIFGSSIDAGSGEEREAINNQVDRAVASQLMTKEDANFIKSYNSKPRLGAFDDQTRAFSINADIVDGKDLGLVNKDIKGALVNGDITPQTARNLLQKSQESANRISTSGGATSKEKMRLAKEHLNALFGSKTMFDKLPGMETERRLKRNQAGSMLLDRMIEHPDLDPRQAAILVGQEIGGMDIRSYPPVAGVPSDKQDSVKELIEQIAITESRFRAGNMSKEKRSSVILQLKLRMDTIKALDATKVEVNQLSQQIMQQRNNVQPQVEEQ